MDAYEAPRPVLPTGRDTREVELSFHGHHSGGSCKAMVTIPKDMKPPDLIRYRGHTFIRRTDERYTEASMWPILEELDE
jgi:hypothetical protein